MRGHVRLQNLFQVRIVGLDQRALHHLAKVEPHPQGNHDDWNGHVFQNAKAEMEVAAASAKFGSISQNISQQRAKIMILQTRTSAIFIALQVGRKQQSEGNEPVKHKVQRGDHAPATANAVEVPGDFFRKVS